MQRSIQCETSSWCSVRTFAAHTFINTNIGGSRSFNTEFYPAPLFDAVYIPTRGTRPGVYERALQFSPHSKEVLFVTYVDGHFQFSDIREGKSPLEPRPCLTSPHHSIATKRNASITRSRRLQHAHILIVDDDIIVEDSVVTQSRQALGYGLDIVSAHSIFHPDISAVDYIRARYTGIPAGVSVSGNFLALSLRNLVSSFPEVYNEDWVFFARNVRENRKLGSCGTVMQVFCKHPTAYQIKNQAVGDLIADGIREDLYTSLEGTDSFWIRIRDMRIKSLRALTDIVPPSVSQLLDHAIDITDAATPSDIHQIIHGN